MAYYIYNTVVLGVWSSAFRGSSALHAVGDTYLLLTRPSPQAMTGLGGQVRYNRLRDQIMDLTEWSKRTAQLAITEACQQGWIVQTDGHYQLPL